MKSVMKLAWTIVASAALGAVFCTFDPDGYSVLAMRRADSLGDTVSVFPTLRFSFSEAIENSYVGFSLQPPESNLDAQLNATKDTVDFLVTGLLQGNTRYTLTTTNVLTSITGNTIQPQTLEFEFYTKAREREPNDVRDTTHRFFDPIYGELHSTQDTDYFYLTDSISTALYLRSHDPGIVLGLGLTDSAGHDTALSSTDVTKYCALPDSFSLPMFIRVYSVFSFGRYELGEGRP